MGASLQKPDNAEPLRYEGGVPRRFDITDEDLFHLNEENSRRHEVRSWIERTMPGIHEPMTSSRQSKPTRVA
ncbi:hypothetical protein AAVH_10289 [Aphelenchoides avenae]|nr:hypothetical protein AAVH_10289 [Aphelenchus avenae]